MGFRNRRVAGTFRPTNLDLASTTASGTSSTNSTISTATSTSLTSSQLNDLTIAGANNPNIPFISLDEMVKFVIYSNPNNTSQPSFFDTWETMIVTIDTTTNGTFSMNTAFVDPSGLRQYIPFSQVKKLMEQFWQNNSMYITHFEVKFRLPKNYISGGSTSINQNSIDPTSAYKQFAVAFNYSGGTPFAIPTAVEATVNAPAQPVQIWYQTINNMILNWRMQSEGNTTTTTATVNTTPTTASLRKPGRR